MPRRTPKKALDNLKQLVRERDRIERLIDDNVLAALAYGLDGRRQLSVPEVAEVLGITKQAVNKRWGPFPKVLSDGE